MNDGRSSRNAPGVAEPHSPGMGGALARAQVALNRGTRASWAQFEPHRRRVMDLIGAEPGGHAALLGAGNCNDVDLGAIAGRFDRVTLVDLDADAMRVALARLPQGLRTKVSAVEADLSGSLVQLEKCRRNRSSHKDVDALLGVAAGARSWGAPASCDLVVSCCVLTQMIASVVSALGERHSACLDVVRAVRARHLQHVLDLLRPRKKGVLVSDLVSSDSCTELASYPAETLAEQMRDLVRAGNFFSGANPFAMAASLRSDPYLGPLVDDARIADPWLWEISPRRTYLVFGITLRRRGAEDRA